MGRKFNEFMERNNGVIKNMILLADLFQKIIFSSALAIVTIFISIAANNISRTSNSIAEVSNTISQQNLELSKQRTAAVFQFKILRTSGVKQYEINKKEGMTNNLSSMLTISVTIHNYTKNIVVENNLISIDLQSKNDQTWIIDGENINLDLKQYTNDISDKISSVLENDRIMVTYDTVINLSYRDYSNNYCNEYYTVYDDEIRYDYTLTENEDAFVKDNRKGNINYQINKIWKIKVRIIQNIRKI